jgi:hypothetical protein
VLQKLVRDRRHYGIDLGFSVNTFLGIAAVEVCALCIALCTRFHVAYTGTRALVEESASRTACAHRQGGFNTPDTAPHYTLQTAFTLSISALEELEESLLQQPSQAAARKDPNQVHPEERDGCAGEPTDVQSARIKLGSIMEEAPVELEALLRKGQLLPLHRSWAWRCTMTQTYRQYTQMHVVFHSGAAVESEATCEATTLWAGSS